MCDTFVATPAVTEHSIMMLAKNSDREANEAQLVTWVPAATHKTHTMAQCTYISIPQVRETRSLLLSRPYWMFGAEMGVNDRGVAIGNEAVFTKRPVRKNDTLTGMDLLRLALERSDTADEAVTCILELIDRWGQGGNCGHTKKLYYHNSFIICDPQNSFILETAGTSWAVRNVATTGSISNCLTLESCDRSSPDAGNGNCNFRQRYSNRVYTYFAGGHGRSQRSLDLMNSSDKKLTHLDMLNILRDHGPTAPFHRPWHTMSRICMHAGGTISAQTTGSMLAMLRHDRAPLIFFTGTSSPCLSVFKPWLHDGRKPDQSLFPATSGPGFDFGIQAGGVYDHESLWWRHELLHRTSVGNWPAIHEQVAQLRNEQESTLLEEACRSWLHDQSQKKITSIRAKLEELHETILQAPLPGAPQKPDADKAIVRYWKKMNLAAKMPSIE